MVARHDALLAVVAELEPCTVRQVFYQASVLRIVDKTDPGYDAVQRALVTLRREGRIGYNAIVDNTRWMRKPRSFNSLQDALDHTAAFYRRSLWTDADDYIEIWLEKDALAGVISPITFKFDVPLMVARGYASLSFLAGAADAIAAQDKPCHIYHLGDFDPSGVNAGEKIEETLRELAPGADITFTRLAVNLDQIGEWNLPTRPTKASDSRAKKFGHAQSVELDAIHPNNLRKIVQNAILDHVDARELEVLATAEASERELLRAFARDALA